MVTEVQSNDFVTDEPIFTRTRYVPRGTRLRTSTEELKYKVIYVPQAIDKIGETRLVALNEALTLSSADLTRLRKAE